MAAARGGDDWLINMARQRYHTVLSTIDLTPKAPLEVEGADETSES